MRSEENFVALRRKKQHHLQTNEESKHACLHIFPNE